MSTTILGGGTVTLQIFRPVRSKRRSTYHSNIKAVAVSLRSQTQRRQLKQPRPLGLQEGTRAEVT